MAFGGTLCAVVNLLRWLFGRLNFVRYPAFESGAEKEVASRSKLGKCRSKKFMKIGIDPPVN